MFTRYIPTLDRCLHLWYMELVAYTVYRKNDGHQNGIQCFGFVLNLFLVNIWRGVRLCGSWKFCVLFVLSFAMRSPYGHRLAVIYDCHHFVAWISCVLVIYCRFLIQSSAIPFSWCALNPTKVSDCDCFVHEFTHAWYRNITLSAWYTLILTPFCCAISQNSWLSLRDSLLLSVVWKWA